MEEKPPIENSAIQLPSQKRTWVSTGTGKGELDEGSSSDNEFNKVNYDLEKKAVRKMDLILMPLMTMFYLLSFLVRIY